MMKVTQLKTTRNYTDVRINREGHLKSPEIVLCIFKMLNRAWLTWLGG